LGDNIKPEMKHIFILYIHAYVMEFLPGVGRRKKNTKHCQFSMLAKSSTLQAKEGRVVVR
jgi:hypothetical protein